MCSRENWIPGVEIHMVFLYVVRPTFIAPFLRSASPQVCIVEASPLREVPFSTRLWVARPPSRGRFTFFPDTPRVGAGARRAGIPVRAANFQDILIQKIDQV